jgi:putative transposase
MPTCSIFVFYIDRPICKAYYSSMSKVIRKAFKFRLKTTPEINKSLANYAGGCRFVWNKALALNLGRLNNKLPILWYEETDFWVTLWKQSDKYSFLKELPSQATQQKLKDLDKAFRDAFDKNQPLKRIPVFKKKGQSDSFRYPRGLRLTKNQTVSSCPRLAGYVTEIAER